jgi:hypothetical protein
MKLLGFVPAPNRERSDISPHEDFGFGATRTPGECASTQPTFACFTHEVVGFRASTQPTNLSRLSGLNAS